MQSSSANDGTAPKLQKLRITDSLTMLQDPKATQRSSDMTTIAVATDDPLALRVRIKSGRLVVFTVTMIVVVAMLLLTFRDGVVLKRFDRRTVAVKQQEAIVEKYNSYSGTVTGALERPIELFLALVMQVVVLRLMTDDVLQSDKRWRVSVAGMVLGGMSTYLITNGLSAVNVQAREQPVRLVITPRDLVTPTAAANLTTTLEKSFSEDQPYNPITNTILRNFVLPWTPPSREICGDRDAMTGEDDVIYRIPQRSWMKDLVPTARESKSMQLVVSKVNGPANEALTPDQFPMNASIAADLLVYSIMDPLEGNAWGITLWNYGSDGISIFPTRNTTEQEDREWFLKHMGPQLYNLSGYATENALLRNWTMTFSHVDIEPDTVWIDAVTVEREVMWPTINSTKDGQPQYYELTYDGSLSIPGNHWFIRTDRNATVDQIGIYSACADSNGVTMVLTNPLTPCVSTSSYSFVAISRSRRLVADEVIEKARIESGKVVEGDGNGVVVNLREIFSVTVARINWKLQDLSARYNAICDIKDGCMGLDVALPGSGKRLVVGVHALPLALLSRFANDNVMIKVTPLKLVWVRRPEYYETWIRSLVSNRPEFIGDILMGHNVRNITGRILFDNQMGCSYKYINRLTMYVDNHIYMEHTLQPTYTTAAMFLLQSGVVHDVLNQTWRPQRMLAFSGNAQDIDVYVYIPQLNVIFSLVGCALLMVAIVIVVVWPYVGLRGRSDPLAHITTSHTIANVMLNDSAFPSLLLKRSIANSGSSADNVDHLLIHSLSLEPKKMEQKDGANDNKAAIG